MTADSVGEQASAGLDRLSEEEFARFHRLNAAYREKFGFPFIICVRRHTRNSILRQFERRLGNEPAAELAAAREEVFRIVALRLDQKVGAPDRLNVHGRLSTHVLDTRAGRPAAGVAIELTELSDRGERRLVERMLTNPDGRTDAPLIHERPIPIGRYELSFAMGDYSPASRRRSPSRRSSTWCRSGFPSPSRKATTTFHSWPRPGATRHIAGVELPREWASLGKTPRLEASPVVAGCVASMRGWHTDC